MVPRPVDKSTGVLGRLLTQGVPHVSPPKGTVIDMMPQHEHIVKVLALCGEVNRFAQGIQLGGHPARVLNELLDDPDLTTDERYNVEGVWTIVEANLPRHLRAEMVRTR
jgi:hypothetical protein